jgi:aminopeptidase
MALTNFSQTLEKYAELTVKVGLNLRPGQRLLISNPSTLGVQLHVAPLVRQIALNAYQAGARFVDVIWGDDQVLRLRYDHAPHDSFTEFPTWHVNGMMDILNHGDAYLVIRSNNPDLLKDQDPKLVGIVADTYWKQMEPVNEAITRNATNWCVIAAPRPDWAVKVFPDLSDEAAEEKLWQAILEITRVDQPDPLAAWQDHIRDLLARSRYLNAKQYATLKYKAPGTDLTIGLPKGHLWISARMTAKNGIDFTANLPTEEVFTLPHKDRIDGVVTASMPLSYSGMLIENIQLTFEKGRVVKASATKSEAVLQKLIATDAGAAGLGEVALVPHSSPVARRGHLFFDALIDENAASHLALGSAYRFTLKDGDPLSEEQFAARGGNTSLVHVDFMVGSEQMDIDGVKEDGTCEPVMRGGEWAFDSTN